MGDPIWPEPHQPPISALIEQLIARNQTRFGHDLRLGQYEIVERDGEWRLRVETHSPSGAEEPADTAPSGTA